MGRREERLGSRVVQQGDALVKETRRVAGSVRSRSEVWYLWLDTENGTEFVDIASALGRTGPEIILWKSDEFSHHLSAKPTKISFDRPWWGAAWEVYHGAVCLFLWKEEEQTERRNDDKDEDEEA